MNCTCAHAVPLANGGVSHRRWCAAFDRATAPPVTAERYAEMEKLQALPLPREGQA